MSGPSLRLLAPAKLNLFLHITGRRADGYHLLQTLYQLLDYGDTMHFDLAPPGITGLHCGNAKLPLDQNLILQAVNLLRAQAKDLGISVSGIDINLTKRIPMGAGLGGGSSNAATTLLALNQLWQLQLSTEKLCQLGLQLGADVPVFVHASSAWAEGVGDQLQAVTIPEFWYLVITPNCEVSTAEIFSHQQLTRDTSAIKMADFLAALARNLLDDSSRNDCEQVTRRLYPEVDQALNWLAQFAKARMTGSGASVFALFQDRNKANQVYEKMPDGFSGFVAKGVNCLEQTHDLDVLNQGT